MLEFGYPRWMVPCIGLVLALIAIGNFHGDGKGHASRPCEARAEDISMASSLTRLLLLAPAKPTGEWQFVAQKALAILMGGCILSHVIQVTVSWGRSRACMHVRCTDQVALEQSGKKKNAGAPLFFLACTIALPILAGKEPWEVVLPMHIGACQANPGVASRMPVTCTPAARQAHGS